MLKTYPVHSQELQIKNDTIRIPCSFFVSGNIHFTNGYEVVVRISTSSYREPERIKEWRVVWYETMDKRKVNKNYILETIIHHEK